VPLNREIMLRSFDIPFQRLFRTLGFPVSAPFHIAFAVTYRCLNLCNTCHSFRKSNTKELSLKEYSKVFDRMSFTPFCLTFTGGEPFMRDDFGKIAALACNRLNPPLVMIESCGDNPDRIFGVMKTLVDKYDSTQFMVWLSMDSSGEDLDRMRGGVPDSFETELRTYHLLKQISARNLMVGFNVLMSKYNIEFGNKLIDDVFSLYPDFVALDVAFGCEALGVVAVDVAPDQELFEEVVELYIDRVKSSGGRRLQRFMNSFLVRRARMISKNLDTMQRSRKCFAAHAYLYVDPSGSVKDCPVAAREMGDLRENQFDLERILNSATARGVRAGVNLSECFCTMSAPGLANIFLSPVDYLSLAREIM